MSKHYYSTYFDAAYVPQGRVLLESLLKFSNSSQVFVLALDDVAYAEVLQWTDLNVQVVSVAQLIARFPQLNTVRRGRTRVEFYFTLTPWLLRWGMQQIPVGSWVTYLDADMMFFSSPEPVYRQLETSSIALVEHRFTWEQRWRRRYGRFNVGWVGFRNSESGNLGLDWWSDQCLAWCFDKVSHGRFADQGYLDYLPELFPEVGIIEDPGMDVAPWNLRRHRIATSRDSLVLVDGHPLIFYHYHGLRRQGERFNFKHLSYLATTNDIVREAIYRPYCLELHRVQDLLAAASGAAYSTLGAQRSGSAVFAKGLLHRLGRVRRDYLDLAPSEGSALD